MIKLACIIKSVAQCIAIPVGLAVCVFNGCSDMIGFENVLLTSMSLLTFEAAM